MSNGIGLFLVEDIVMVEHVVKFWVPVEGGLDDLDTVTCRDVVCIYEADDRAAVLRVAAFRFVPSLCAADCTTRKPGRRANHLASSSATMPFSAAVALRPTETMTSRGSTDPR